MTKNLNIFAPSAAFKAKCAQMTAKTAMIRAMHAKAVDELTTENQITLDKFSRVEKLNIIKKVAA